MDIHRIYTLFQQYPVICTDSRQLAKDAIFFALKGNTYDGNAFAREALGKGCSYAVVDSPDYALDDRFVLVEDALLALQELAALHRKQISIPVLAITGSNGKTTTKELCSAILSEKYRVAATKGNLNNHIGVPLTLLALREHHQVAVIEMGANHLGEIARLCQIANPSLGIITNIGKAHLEGFGGSDGVVRAKKELYDHIRESGGTLFVNADNEHLMSLSQSIARLTYGTTGQADIKGGLTAQDPFVAIAIAFPGSTNKLLVQSQLTGVYNAENILAAVAVGHYFGIDPQAINHAVESYRPQNMRSQVMDTVTNRLILDAYNANPSSMEAALANFSLLEGTDKYLILGDMYELGSETQTEHLHVLGLIRHFRFTAGILVGEQLCALPVPTGFHSFPSVQEVHRYLEQHPIRNKLVLIKGSRAVGLETIINLL